MYGGPALVQPLLPALIDVCLKVAGRAGRATRAGVGGSQDPSQVSIVETAKQPSKCVGHCAQLRFPVGGSGVDSGGMARVAKWDCTPGTLSRIFVTSSSWTRRFVAATDLRLLHCDAWRAAV